jgi:hypothetical protein
MSSWDDYPRDYRAAEVRAVLAAARAGECVSIVGLSGAGKSNLMGFLAYRCGGAGLPALHLVDCNRLGGFQLVEGGQTARVFALVGEVLGGEQPAATLRALEALVESGLRQTPAGLCLLFDRFDILNDPALDSTASGLRALRDRFKYRLTYITATRRPLYARSELAELFYANTLWLGPLAPADALWSAGQYALRRGLDWDRDCLERLVELSGGYPSFLRAACEAHAAGCPLDAPAVRSHPAVRRRVDEFWADQPAAEDLRSAGLEAHPWLERLPSPERIDPAELTAAEQRLLDYLRLHPGQVCVKDELIRAVWPEEVVTAGLRDDSLAQLVHRLREKIGAKWVQTVPGRGYRYQA